MYSLSWHLLNLGKGWLYAFAMAAVTKYHKLCGINHRNVLSRGPESWKSKM